ncbi:MAG TPA: TIGR03842 family LLM class F420-dependent oxidoreductase [Aggregatilineales bacterium]|nr:TIGR03842 family LLM class F420-dependent oxidoreductase [Aggregatilineales bacterium]
MEFGITFKGDIKPKRTIALCKQAEVAGFSHAWFFDSHVLWQECYTMMAACMLETETLRFGPCVTNPGVRDWTVAASMYASLNLIGGNRLDIGVGRGDSSRRVLGRKPLTVETMVEFVEALRVMVSGEKYVHEGQPVQLTWSHSGLPIWVAGYGPKALAAAGESADGLILQIADPWLVKWFVDQAKEAGTKAGRDMSTFRVMSAAPIWIGDIKTARRQTRWFPAMVGNHVADLVERYGKAGASVPKRLTDYIEGRKGYDYLHHADKDADHLGFIKDDIIDSFGVLGTPDRLVAKLKELEAVGVTQFNIYLMCGEEERNLAEFAEHVLPHFAKQTVVSGEAS